MYCFHALMFPQLILVTWVILEQNYQDIIFLDLKFTQILNILDCAASYTFGLKN